VVSQRVAEPGIQTEMSAPVSTADQSHTPGAPGAWPTSNATEQSSGSSRTALIKVSVPALKKRSAMSTRSGCS
jgi:hypothetical protein